MWVSDLSRTLEPTGKVHSIEKLYFQNLPQGGRMPKVGLDQSTSLEEYPGCLVHQFPPQLLQNGVTGLDPGVNQTAYGGSGLDPSPVLYHWTATPSQRNSLTHVIILTIISGD